MPNPYIAAIGLAVDVGTKLADGRTEEAFDGLNPFASASSAPIEVTIPSGSQVQVEHKLGKVPTGKQIICSLGGSDIFEYKVPDKLFFFLENGGGVDVTIKMLVS